MPQSARDISTFKTKEVTQFFAVAKRLLKHPNLDILVAPATQLQGRILVITSRKVGNSPQRNKIRRQLKAIFYENQYTQRGYDCVVIVKKDGILLSFTQLQDVLAEVFQKVEPINNHST